MLEPDEVAVLRQARQEPRAWQPKTERWSPRPAPLRDCSWHWPASANLIEATCRTTCGPKSASGSWT